jgi:hypothetical protein
MLAISNLNISSCQANAMAKHVLLNIVLKRNNNRLKMKKP